VLLHLGEDGQPSVNKSFGVGLVLVLVLGLGLGLALGLGLGLGSELAWIFDDREC